jgi:peroxiredoxin
MKKTMILSVCLALLVASGLGGAGLKVGSTVENFTLKTVDGNDVQYAELAGNITVLTFIATQCPISNDYNERMKAIYADYHPKGVKFVFINSNHTEPAAEVKQHAASNGFQFQVYKDPGNVVADMFGAQFTPEVYVVKGGKVAYHGRIDDARKGEIKDHSLRNALDALLAGKAPAAAETKAFGCTIKRVKVS